MGPCSPFFRMVIVIFLFFLMRTQNIYGIIHLLPNLMFTLFFINFKLLSSVNFTMFWLQYLLTDLQVPSVSAPIIWCDNLGATYLSTNPIFHARTKHVEVDYHFVCDWVAKKEIQIRFIPYRDQLADVFTKPLSAASFTAFRFKLRVDPPPSA